MANDQLRDDQDESNSSGSQGSSQGKEGGMGETIKKLVSAGVSAAFMTEEGIRGFVSDMKLPKETLNVLLQGASKSKDELMNRVSREVIGIISKIDFVKEASRFVEEHKFKVSAEIEVIRKEKPRESSDDVSEKSSDRSTDRMSDDSSKKV